MVVDAANVVGSRPDGWWKDRAGATARLHARLVAAVLPADRILLVVEGRARPGVRAGIDDTVETIHAPNDGDATIAAVVERVIAEGASVQVVTADQQLSAIVTGAGAVVRGPGWLLERLPS